MLDLLAEIRQVTGSDAEFVLVDERFLLDEGVEPWEELPLWLAAEAHPDFAGMMAVAVSRAQKAGLRHRPLAETVRETLAWEEQPVRKDYGPSALAHGLDLAKERELLAAWASRPGSVSRT
jgi:2'-hydroxyisoflavone reductase